MKNNTEKNIKKLAKLTNTYGDKKAKEKKLKEDVAGLNEAIKTLMKQEQLLDFVTDKYKVNYQTKHTVSLNEEQVINILLQNNIDGIIKTKMYVDEDALETAIFNGKLPADVVAKIADAKIDKETIALSIKEIKK